MFRRASHRIALLDRTPKSNAASPKTRNLATAFAGACLLFSIGAPNACVDVHEADIEKDGAGTFADPEIVRRDNLAMGGILTVTDSSVRATVSSPYLTDGKFTNVTGHLRVTEFREHAWPYLNQDTPILPKQNATGSGNIYFGTRATSMVHGNTYAVSVTAQDKKGEKFNIDKAKYVKLADDVMVVPVVIVSWKKPGGDPSFVNETYPARNMFDFNPIGIENQSSPAPYFRSNNTKMTPLGNYTLNPLYPAVIDSPSDYFFKQMAPDLKELPPDEIWDDCGIQFQVVAQFIAVLPANWQNNCNDKALNFAQPEWEIQKQMANAPVLRDYLLNDLKPIFVSYGDNSLCSTGYSQHSFFGNTPGKGNHIEIGFNRPRSVTAHELGHALSLDHALHPVTKKPLEGNLMRENPINGESQVTQDQCKQARTVAATYSARYDYFNWATGRTYSEMPPPPPKGGNTWSDDIDDFNPGFGASFICCSGPTDVYQAAPGSCPGKQVADSQCSTVCCSGVTNMSRYLCTKTGGAVGAGQPCAPK